MTTFMLYLGAMTQPLTPGGAAQGITLCHFDDESGTLSAVAAWSGIDNPSWLTVDAPRHRLYAVSEVESWNEGTVTAYAIDPATGRLAYVNKQPSLGNTPCHVGVSPDGRFLAVANYATTPTGTPPDQSIAFFHRDDAGELPPPCARLRHKGRGSNPERQERAHAHCALFTPEGDRLLVVDLGLDRLVAYDVAPTGALMARPESDFAFEPGRGPRHAVFHPDGRTLYVDHELRAGVTVLARKGEGWEHVQTIDIPDDRQTWPSAIAISPDGRHIYVAVRVTGEIVGFAVAPDRSLAEIGRWPGGASWPRDMALSPSGRHLLVANQDAHKISVLRRNEETGALTLLAADFALNTPMRVAFA